MSFFRRPDYTSEITQFLEKYKIDHPGLEARQREGRALLWDKVVDRQQASDNLESSKSAQQPPRPRAPPGR